MITIHFDRNIRPYPFAHGRNMFDIGKAGSPYFHFDSIKTGTQYFLRLSERIFNGLLQTNSKIGTNFTALTT